MQLTDWLLVEVALLLPHWSDPNLFLLKTGFDRLGRDQSSFRRIKTEAESDRQTRLSKAWSDQLPLPFPLTQM